MAPCNLIALLQVAQNVICPHQEEMMWNPSEVERLTASKHAAAECVHGHQSRAMVTQVANVQSQENQCFPCDLYYIGQFKRLTNQIGASNVYVHHRLVSDCN